MTASSSRYKVSANLHFPFAGCVRVPEGTTTVVTTGGTTGGNSGSSGQGGTGTVVSDSTHVNHTGRDVVERWTIHPYLNLLLCFLLLSFFLSLLRSSINSLLKNFLCPYYFVKNPPAIFFPESFIRVEDEFNVPIALSAFRDNSFIRPSLSSFYSSQLFFLGHSFCCRVCIHLYTLSAFVIIPFRSFLSP